MSDLVQGATICHGEEEGQFVTEHKRISMVVDVCQFYSFDATKLVNPKIRGELM